MIGGEILRSVELMGQSCHLGAAFYYVMLMRGLRMEF